MTTTKKRRSGGRKLEQAVLASQRDIVRLEKIPNGVRWLKGGKTVNAKGPVDFGGEFVGTGHAIWFDAKEFANKNIFEVGHDSIVKPHQKEFLIRHGEAGAVAGLLIEGTHPNVAAYYWLDWRHLGTKESSIRWDDPRMMRLGSNAYTIDFSRLKAR